MSNKVFVVSSTQEILLYGQQCTHMLEFLSKQNSRAVPRDLVEDSVFLVNEIYKKLLNVDHVLVTTQIDQIKAEYL